MSGTNVGEDSLRTLLAQERVALAVGKLYMKTTSSLHPTNQRPTTLFSNGDIVIYNLLHIYIIIASTRIRSFERIRQLWPYKTEIL